MKNPMIEAMTAAFLRWRLPDSVCADPCASKQGPGRLGTNLLSAVEAYDMLCDVVLPSIPHHSSVILSDTPGNHHLTLDTKDSYFRVNINGVTRAMFNAICTSTSEAEALLEAVAYYRAVEAEALAHPKG